MKCLTILMLVFGPIGCAGRARTPSVNADLEDERPLDMAPRPVYLERSAIHVEARNGNVAVVKDLLRRNPLLARHSLRGAKEVGEYTPLHEAAAGGHTEVAEELLAHGADVNAAGGRATPLEMAACNGHRRVAELLISRGAKLDLFTSAGLGRVDRVRASIDQDKNCAHATHRDGGTPLHWAVRAGQKDVVELLLRSGADVNANVEGQWLFLGTPLHVAVRGNRKTMAALLLAHRADVNAKAVDDCGRSPLHIACFGRRASLVKLLLAHNADVNARQTGGFTGLGALEEDMFVPTMETPLHFAAYSGDTETVQLLLAHKADVYAREKRWGRTPLATAIAYERQEAADLLRKHGAKE